MRKTLAAWVVLVTVSSLTLGCSSSNGGGSGSGGTSGGMNTGSGGSSSGSGGASGAGSGGSGSSANCVLPTTWTDNLGFFGEACISCAQTYCCDAIVKCAKEPDCLAIYNCEQKCYETSDDGGLDGSADDAGTTPEDQCVEACRTNGSATGKPLYEAQDSCVNGEIPMTCGKKGTCN